MGIRKKILKKLCLSMESQYLSGAKAQGIRSHSVSDSDKPAFRRAIDGFERGNQLFTFFPEQYQVRLLRGKNVLDLGCHSGGAVAYYAYMGADTVVGLDIVYGRVSEAKKFALYKKVRNAIFVQGDA